MISSGDSKETAALALATEGSWRLSLCKSFDNQPRFSLTLPVGDFERLLSSSESLSESQSSGNFTSFWRVKMRKV
jgi:hypothetical protein